MTFARRIRYAACLVAVLAALDPMFGVARAERRRIDGVAAVVGASAPREGAIVILASDVELEAWLSRATANDFRIDVGPPDAAERDAARERLIGRALLVFESTRLRLGRIDAARREEALQRLYSTHGGIDTVLAIAQRVGLADGELDRYVEAELLARSFVLASAEQGGIVTDAELELAWEQGDPLFVGMDLEMVREQFRAHLLELRIRAETARWIEVVRARVVVRRTRRG